MTHSYIHVEQSKNLAGELFLEGAKNAVLVSMMATILAEGVSCLKNVPASDDVFQMIFLLESLGARVFFDREQKVLTIDTTQITDYRVNPEIMKKMRASSLAMGPLLARMGRAQVSLPGGCLLGERSLDLHFSLFRKMGAEVVRSNDSIEIKGNGPLTSALCVLTYPSVGATENALMAAVLGKRTTTVVNAALEPEVLDLISMLQRMGAFIEICPPATLRIEGVASLQPVEHVVINDRLEAGTLILAAAVAGGSLSLPDAPAHSMEVFLELLSTMGHAIEQGPQGRGIFFTASKAPRAVSFKTMPYPGFPTDLQAPMLVAQCCADGISVIEETVFENRLMHVRELQKMGANITVSGTTATIKGVDALYGANVIGADIRATAGLVVAGLAASGTTSVSGVHHLNRGYSNIIEKLRMIGGDVQIVSSMPYATRVVGATKEHHS